MKRVIAICLMCALSACASTGSKDSAKSDTELNSSGYDENYMAMVERNASRHGVIVKWINPPRAPKAKKDGQ